MHHTDLQIVRDQTEAQAAEARKKRLQQAADRETQLLEHGALAALFGVLDRFIHPKQAPSLHRT